MSTLPFTDIAADYLAGLLPAEEAVAFELRLSSASAEEIACYAELQEAAALLELSSTEPLKAPMAARDRIIAAISPQASSQGEVFTYVMNDEGWAPLPLPVPGARWKPLGLHPDGSPRMFLLELPPGCEFPDHPHPGVEECLLLKGDLINDGRRLGPGDYVSARAGTHHHGLRTEEGCVCLLILNAA